MESLAEKLRPYFESMEAAVSTIRVILEGYADGKKLKGDELVGWVAEVYAKLLLGGVLVSDRFEHDVGAGDYCVSVKGRKGQGSSWMRTSAIPKIEGDGCPTHLLFVHLNDDYSVDRIWLYPWNDLVANNRFGRHMVRQSQRSWIFNVKPAQDATYLVYSGTAAPKLYPSPTHA